MRAIALLAALLFSLAARSEELLVVANPQVPAASASLKDLAAIYLIQRATWANGVPVVPVNREAESGIRAQFSQEVFNRSPRELADYWNRLRFQGKMPPLVQTSDQAVLGFVRSVPGAIGYIDYTGSRQAPPGVKVLPRAP